MDFQAIALWFIGGVMTLLASIFGWFSRQLWGAVQELKVDLNTLKVEIGTNYIRYDRLKDMLDPIMDSLTEIKATIKEKADK
jgi:hypothetical protein